MHLNLFFKPPKHPEIQSKKIPVPYQDTGIDPYALGLSKPVNHFYCFTIFTTSEMPFTCRFTK